MLPLDVEVHIRKEILSEAIGNCLDQIFPVLPRNTEKDFYMKSVFFSIYDLCAQIFNNDFMCCEFKNYFFGENGRFYSLSEKQKINFARGVFSSKFVKQSRFPDELIPYLNEDLLMIHLEFCSNCGDFKSFNTISKQISEKNKVIEFVKKLNWFEITVEASEFLKRDFEICKISLKTNYKSLYYFDWKFLLANYDCSELIDAIVEKLELKDLENIPSLLKINPRFVRRCLEKFGDNAFEYYREDIQDFYDTYLSGEDEELKELIGFLLVKFRGKYELENKAIKKLLGIDNIEDTVFNENTPKIFRNDPEYCYYSFVNNNDTYEFFGENIKSKLADSNQENEYLRKLRKALIDKGKLMAAIGPTNQSDILEARILQITSERNNYLNELLATNTQIVPQVSKFLERILYSTLKPSIVIAVKSYVYQRKIEQLENIVRPMQDEEFRGLNDIMRVISNCDGDFKLLCTRLANTKYRHYLDKYVFEMASVKEYSMTSFLEFVDGELDTDLYNQIQPLMEKQSNTTEFRTSVAKGGEFTPLFCLKSSNDSVCLYMFNRLFAKQEELVPNELFKSIANEIIEKLSEMGLFTKIPRYFIETFKKLLLEYFTNHYHRIEFSYIDTIALKELSNLFELYLTKEEREQYKEFIKNQLLSAKKKIEDYKINYVKNVYKKTPEKIKDVHFDDYSFEFNSDFWSKFPINSLFPFMRMFSEQVFDERTFYYNLKLADTGLFQFALWLENSPYKETYAPYFSVEKLRDLMSQILIGPSDNLISALIYGNIPSILEEMSKLEKEKVTTPDKRIALN